MHASSPSSINSGASPRRAIASRRTSPHSRSRRPGGFSVSIATSAITSSAISSARASSHAASSSSICDTPSTLGAISCGPDAGRAPPRPPISELSHLACLACSVALGLAPSPAARRRRMRGPALVAFGLVRRRRARAHGRARAVGRDARPRRVRARPRRRPAARRDAAAARASDPEGRAIALADNDGRADPGEADRARHEGDDRRHRAPAGLERVADRQDRPPGG